MAEIVLTFAGGSIALHRQLDEQTVWMTALALPRSCACVYSSHYYIVLFSGINSLYPPIGSHCCVTPINSVRAYASSDDQICQETCSRQAVSQSRHSSRLFHPSRDGFPPIPTGLSPHDDMWKPPFYCISAVLHISGVFVLLPAHALA